MAHERRDWPVVSLADAYRDLTTPDAPFEMETIDVDGRSVRVYKKAHRDLRAMTAALHGRTERSSSTRTNASPSTITTGLRQRSPGAWLKIMACKRAIA
jgi:hypothetical protein